jgi:protein SCO1/2
MNRPSGKFEWTIWGGLFLVMAAIFALFVASRFRPKPLPVFNSLPDFTLTDQNGKTVSLSTLQGTVWVTDVIFTRCPFQCLRMSQNMKKVRAELPEGANLVSITTDPGYDSPEVFKKYAANLGVDDGRWLFLTGEKSTIQKLVVDGLKLSAVENKPEQMQGANDFFVHSTKFVLIDKQGKIRGWFDGEDADARPQLISAIKNILREK